MGKFNEKRFIFHETFTNYSGKTSGSGFIGVITGLIAGVSFLASMIGYFLGLPNTVEVMGQILMLVGASTLLLGVRKVSGNFSNVEEDRENNKSNETDKG